MGRPLAGWGGIQKAALDYGLGTDFDDFAPADDVTDLDCDQA